MNSVKGQGISPAPFDLFQSVYSSGSGQAAHLRPIATPKATCNVSMLKAVVADTTPFETLPGWVIMNAPRPLLGDKVANGEFLTGRFYAAIDTSVEFATELIARNVRDDACVVFLASKCLQEAMAVETISPVYRAAYRKMEPGKRSQAISTFVFKLSRDRTYGELIELARVATITMKEDAAIVLATKRTPSLPFMNHVGGRVVVFDGDSGHELPAGWIGICSDAGDTKALWLLGFDGGERSFRRLQSTSLEAAITECEGLTATVEIPAATPSVSSYTLDLDMSPVSGGSNEWKGLNRSEVVARIGALSRDVLDFHRVYQENPWLEVTNDIITEAYKADKNIGLQWHSAHGREVITERLHYRAGDLYEVSSVTHGGYRRYTPGQLEEAISRDEYSLTPEYAAAQAKAAANLRIAEEAKQKAAAYLSAKSARIDAFTTSAGYTTMRAGQAKKALLKLVRHNGAVMSSFEFVDALVTQCLETRLEQEDRIKPMTRRAYNRASNEEQHAHEKRIRMAGQKTVYYLGNYEVGAFEYAYAGYLQAAHNHLETA